MFQPSDFVDISVMESRRHAACYAHASQTLDYWYPLQSQLTHFRGTQSGYAQAEGFLRQWEGASISASLSCDLRNIPRYLLAFRPDFFFTAVESRATSLGAIRCL